MSDLKDKFSAEEIYNRILRMEKGNMTVSEDGYISTVGKSVDEMTYPDLEKAVEAVGRQIENLRYTYYEPWKNGNRGHHSWKQLVKERSALIGKIREVRPDFVRERKERAKRSRDEQRIIRLDNGARIPITPEWRGRHDDDVEGFKKKGSLANLKTEDWLLAHPYFHKMAIKDKFIEDPNATDTTDLEIVEARKIGWLSRFTGWLNSAAEWVEDSFRKLLTFFGWK
jgi:hypothetical protein